MGVDEVLLFGILFCGMISIKRTSANKKGLIKNKRLNEPKSLTSVVSHMVSEANLKTCSYYNYGIGATVAIEWPICSHGEH